MTPREIAEETIRYNDQAREQGWPVTYPLKFESLARAYLDLEQRSVPRTDAGGNPMIQKAIDFFRSGTGFGIHWNEAADAITTLRTALAAAQERAKNAERERDAARARNAAYYTALLACRGTNMGSYYCVEPAEAWEAVAALLRTEEPEASILAEYEARGRVVEAVTTYLEYWEPALPPDDGPSREAADRLNAALDALRAQTTRGVGA